jgi:hypothetical protein
MGSSCDLIEVWLWGEDLPVRDFEQSTGLIDRRSWTFLTLQVLSMVNEVVCAMSAGACFCGE